MGTRKGGLSPSAIGICKNYVSMGFAGVHLSYMTWGGKEPTEQARKEKKKNFDNSISVFGIKAIAILGHHGNMRTEVQVQATSYYILAKVSFYSHMKERAKVEP